MNHFKELAPRAALALAALLVLTTVGLAAGPSEVWTTRLSGQNEVPPNDSKAHGSATIRVVRDGKEITSIEYRVRVSNLNDLTAGHIHSGAEGVAGPVVVNLNPRIGSGRAQGIVAEGSFDAGDLAGPLTGMTLEDLYALFTSGEAYVNLHTTLHPGGEIRGQLSARGGGGAQ